jgi:hypothetical protein
VTPGASSSPGVRGPFDVFPVGVRVRGAVAFDDSRTTTKLDVGASGT